MGLTNHHVVENDTMTAGELLDAIILTLPMGLTISVNEKANGLATDFTRSNLFNAPSQADTNASIEAICLPGSPAVPSALANQGQEGAERIQKPYGYVK